MLLLLLVLLFMKQCVLESRDQVNYKDYNDYELVSYAVGETSEEALDILYEKYRPMITSFAKKMLPLCEAGGLELNDLVQEGMLGLNNAIEHFNEKKDITFYTFAKTCIERKIISATVASRRKKHKILNESLPFEVRRDDSEPVYTDYLLKDDSTDPENVLLNHERENSLSNLINDKLTDFELQVFELKLNHFTYEEISTILDKNVKSIDNALQRIKSKVKKILKELD